VLTTRPAKLEKGKLFSRDLRFDVLDGDRPIGSLVYDTRKYAAWLELDGKAFAVERLYDRPDEMLYQTVWRWLTAREKPPPNPYVLKATDGSTLAVARQSKRSFAISRGDEKFSFRRVARPYHLYREGSEQSLGSVGQEKVFTRTLHMDLPAEFDPPFQLFLLVLLINASWKTLESSSSGYTP
jgi:hypothetical protein